METTSQISSLPELALKYGTINQDQFDQAVRLYNLNKKQGINKDYKDILLELKLATNYQVGLIGLIQEYQIIKKKGKEFGRIAIKKGFATPADVKAALDYQKQEFRKAKKKLLIGDILVESGVITTKQKNIILKEQLYIEQQTEKILSNKTGKPENIKGADISDTETHFLKIKTLDQEFAASAIEKGFVTKTEVSKAQAIQEKEFETQKHIHLIAEIMVGLNYLSEEQKNTILIEQKRLVPERDKENKPEIKVIFSDDRLEARIEITGDIDKVSLNDINNILQANKINRGVYPAPILQCHLDNKNTSFTVARQDSSKELMVNSNTKYHFDLGKGNKQSIDKGATLVKQDHWPETMVKKNLVGETKELPLGHDFSFRCGIGTRLSRDRTKAFAAKSGFPSLSIERKLYVHPVANVLEDADLKYGALEKYANLKILGILTGAYPVRAGNIEAREIRGADVEAVGSIKSNIGISESLIDAQGNIHARYIHGSTILCFGNLYVENEIIDSRIYCSGTVKSGKCRIISSDIYAKKGIELGGAGNNRTRPCILAAGTEHHLLEKSRLINSQIEQISSALEDLNEEIISQTQQSKKTFQKMVELKIFHDRAKQKKETLTHEFKKKRNDLPKDKLKNIVKLVNNFKTRMDSSVEELKELNRKKKRGDARKTTLEKKYRQMEAKIKRETADLKTDLYAFAEWSRRQKNIPKIKINFGVSAGTIFRGIYSNVQTKNEIKKSFAVCEKQSPENSFSMRMISS